MRHPNPRPACGSFADELPLRLAGIAATCALVIHQPGGPEAMRLQLLAPPKEGPHQGVDASDAGAGRPAAARPERSPGRLAPAGRRHRDPAAGPAGPQAGGVGAGPWRRWWVGTL